MSIHRIRLLCHLALALLLMSAAEALAQTRIPTENTLEDLQLFAPADNSGYGDKPYLKEGLFFVHDFLAWSVQRPDAATIGDPGRTRLVFDNNTFRFFTESNAIDTSMFSDQVHTGTRTELGYINDCAGWMFSHTELHEVTDRFVASNAAVIFNDPQGITVNNFVQITRGARTFDADLDGDRIYGRDGEDLGTFFAIAPFPTPHPQPADPGGNGNPLIPSSLPNTGRPPHDANSLGDGVRPGFYLPYDGIPDSFPNGNVPDGGDLVPGLIDFDDLVVTNTTDIWGMELMAMRRLDHISYGGHWELFAGVRYLNFDEQFHVEATGGILADSTWNNEANNLMVGPQFGARWFKNCCRWTFGAEARLAPAVNFQSVRLRSTIGDLDLNSALQFQNTGFESLHEYEFSPIGEVRLNWSYQLTRAIAARAGYSAMYIGGLARPSNMIDYQLPNLKLIRDNNYDNTFMQGINVGIEINR